MNSQALTNVGIIIGALVGLIGVYLAWKQTSTVAAQRQADAIAKEVKDATDPLLAEIARLRESFREQIAALRDKAHADIAAANRTIDRRDATIAALTARVDTLEDELRRGRGYGDDNAQRQPRPGR